MAVYNYYGKTKQHKIRKVTAIFNKSDKSRDQYMLTGKFAQNGYDWWWHSFTGYNHVTGAEKSFFIEFFICNPLLADKEPILGQLQINKEIHEKPSYLMIKVGTWGKDAKQIHKFCSVNKIEIHKSVPFSINADNCYLDENQTYGSVSLSDEQVKYHPEYMCDSGEMSWNIKIDKKLSFNVGYGASKIMRALKAFQMYWHAEGIKTEYSGYVKFNDEIYDIIPEKAYGYADKNWGSDFTSPWLWLSSNNLKSKISGNLLNNSAFDIGGGSPKIGPFKLKGKLLSAFFYEGNCYEFNFSKFWTFTRTTFKCHETEEQIVWHVEQKNLTCKMVTDVTCNKSEMLLINYESPDGNKKHTRLWNGGNGTGTVRLYRFKKLIDEIEARNIGCEYGEYYKENFY